MLAVFGGRHFAAALAFLVSALLVAAWQYPAWRSIHAVRRLAPWIGATVAIVVVQLVPLPAWLADIISPHRDDVARAVDLTVATNRYRPLSIDRMDSFWAACVIVGTAATFVAAMAICSRGGWRPLVRSICAMGLVASVLAVAQAAGGGEAIYGLYVPEHEGPRPFGPFVNRNHFATWVAMALPLCFGYIVARLSGAASRAGTPRHARARIVYWLSAGIGWLATATAVMLAALLLSLSRSGVVSVAAVAMASTVVTWPRMKKGHRRLLVVALVLIGAAAGLFADLSRLAERLEGGTRAITPRVRIWQETLPIVADFPVVGTGAGTFEAAMVVYQRSDRRWYFNQAHNHYLQIAAEGGGLLLAAVIGLLAVLTRLAFGAIRDDHSGVRWLRIGAAGGLVAVAIQSLWETGLTMPANAALAAALAAVLLHDRHTQPHEGATHDPARVERRQTSA